jgi:8-oxo-dGTP pyrophosphatase MutT (NUDIX family)
MGVAAELKDAAIHYGRTAWWGIVSPRVSGARALVVLQGVILREHAGRQQVLLSVRSDLRGWELPGGTLEPGEVDAVALAREVREETGLEVEVGRHVGDYVRTGFRPHTARVHCCRVLGGELRPSSETPVVQWFDCDRVPDTFFPWYHRPLADALDEGAAPVERHERQGIAAILAGMRIDLRMRLSENRAGLP